MALQRYIPPSNVHRKVCLEALVGGMCPPSDEILDNYPPSIPQNIVAVVIAYNQIDVYWDESFDDVGIMGYELWVDGEILDLSNRLLYHHTHLEGSSSHTYKVRAYDFSHNFSQWSEEVVAVTSPAPDTELPTRPMNVEAIHDGADKIDVTWDASTDNDGIEGYLILHDGEIDDVGNVLEFHDTGLDACTPHEYYVRAYDAGGNMSPWSYRVIEYTSCGPVVEDGEQVEESGVDVYEG